MSTARIARVAIALVGALLPLLGVADEPAPAALAVEHVTVLPMTIDGGPLRDVTVVVRDGRVAFIGPRAQAGSLSGVKRIDATGKWLIPGLTDVHAHIENDRMARLFLQNPKLPDGTFRTEDVLTPYVVNGVVQVVSLQAMSESIGQRVDVNAGRVLGPHLVLAAMIDGAPPIWPVGMTRVVGHIPERGKGHTDKFFQPGFDMVAHAEEFAQQTDPPSIAAIPPYVEMMKRNGTWLTATLSLDDRLLEETQHPETLKSRPELRAALMLTRSQARRPAEVARRESPDRH